MNDSIRSILRPVIGGKTDSSYANKINYSFQDEIRNVSSQMECVDTWFQIEEDQDLVEACIYEKESLKARYRYLIKKAKEAHITLPPSV